MTLLVDRGVAGPATHVLAVGVAHYRHLPGGEGPCLQRSLGLGQIRAPAPSVQDLIDFLVTEYRNSVAPLGTIALLRSPAGPAGGSGHAPAEPVAVEGATMAAVKAAVQGWFQRCTTDPRNVALFYFCGHGVERDHQYLLMEDFGAFEPALLDNSLDLARFHCGMAQCAAQTQLFFVDACRELPRELTSLVSGSAQSVLDERVEGNLARDAPILWAAAQGRKAFALEGQSTQFSQALLQALRGAGAAQEPDDPERWSVRYNSLAAAVGQLLRADRPPELVQEVRTGGGAGDALIQELSGPPAVPVVVECQPEACAQIAALELAPAGGAGAYSRAPAPGPWKVDAPAGPYQLRAEVTPPYASVPRQISVWPPRRRFTVEVTQ